MSHHPTTPTRVARYVPPPQYGMGQVAGMESQQHVMPTSDGSWTVPPPSYSYNGPSTPSQSFVSSDPPFMRSSNAYSAPDSVHFGTDARGSANHSTFNSTSRLGINGASQQHRESSPRYSNQYEAHKPYEEEHTSLWSRSKRILDRDQNARSLFVASSVLLLYASIQMVWALIVESHSLFAASFWSLYMSISLGVTFLMQSVSKQKPTSTYMYGYGRVEVVASFTNASLLLFAGLYVSFEALEGLIEPTHAHEHIFQLALAVIGIIIHSICATVFPDALAPRTEAPSALYTMRHTSQMRLKVSSLFSHLFGPLAILLVALTGSSFMDAILALLLSGYLFVVSIPLCWKSGRVLLQAVPSGLKDLIDRSLYDIAHMQGVVKVDHAKTHIWTLSPGVHVGTVTIVISDEADQAAITQAAVAILKPYIYHLTVQASVKHHHEGHNHQHEHNHDHHDHHHDHDHEHHHEHDHDHDHHHDHDHDHDHDGHEHHHDHNNGHSHEDDPYAGNAHHFGVPAHQTFDNGRSSDYQEPRAWRNTGQIDTTPSPHFDYPSSSSSSSPAFETLHLLPTPSPPIVSQRPGAFNQF